MDEFPGGEGYSEDDFWRELEDFGEFDGLLSDMDFRDGEATLMPGDITPEDLLGLTHDDAYQSSGIVPDYPYGSGDAPDVGTSGVYSGFDGITGQFLESDIEVARQARDVCAEEFMESGFRSEFDVQPDTADRLGDLSAEHLAAIDSVVGRIQRLGSFVAGVQQFIGVPVTEVVTGVDGFDTIDEYVIDADDVEDYERFHNALVTYVGVLLRHGARTPEVQEAAEAIAQMVDPDAWRDAGVPIPGHVIPLYSLGAAEYLSAVVRLADEDGGQTPDGDSN